MTCHDIDSMLSPYVDDELDEAGRRRVEAHTADCPVCRAKLARLAALGQELSSMTVQPPLDTAFDKYEAHVFARLERGVGWILLSISAVLLLGSGAFYLVRDFLLDPTVAISLRAGVGVGIIGALVLTVATVRHRLATYKKDRYNEVIR